MNELEATSKTFKLWYKQIICSLYLFHIQRPFHYSRSLSLKVYTIEPRSFQVRVTKNPPTPFIIFLGAHLYVNLHLYLLCCCVSSIRTFSDTSMQCTSHSLSSKILIFPLICQNRQFFAKHGRPCIPYCGTFYLKIIIKKMTLSLSLPIGLFQDDNSY